MSPRSRIERRLFSHLARANQDFHLIEPGDRVMVCLSGGKDSYAMAVLLQKMQRVVPWEFELVAVNLDQGHPGFEQGRITAWCEARGLAHHMVRQDTYKVVTELVRPGKTTCSICSRLRRGILYEAAVELGADKIALGHHRDDLIETLLLNLFYAGQLKSMAPRLRSDDGRNTVIRPLAYCPEEELAAFAEERDFPILPCVLCGSQDDMKRQAVKGLIAGLHAENPKVKGNMLAALGNVRASHLLDSSLRAESVQGDFEAALSGLFGDSAPESGPSNQVIIRHGR